MQKKDFELSVLDIFRDKGTTASIAEKSFNNLRARENSIYNLHYFTVQHSFKQIDKKQVFVLDEETSQWTEYLSLGFERFKRIKDDLKTLIKNLRNLNSHYLHFFDFLREDQISPEIITFLKESFRLAVVQSFINEKINEKAETQIGKPLTSDEKVEIVKQCLANETEITDFLKTMFYQSFYVKKKEFEQKQEEKKEKIRYIDRKFDTLDNAIDYILFVNAEEDIDWKLNHAGKGGENDHVHEMLIIAKGRYLSFNAMLFLFSMFLYKNEATQLIPRISGFKKNGTTEDRRKLNVFLFYAKKFSSQDIDSEHKKLVYFRDIIQYLNKFPLEWNKALEGKESENVKDFKNKIYKMEMEREFKLEDDLKFVDYAFSKFFTTEKMDKIELYEMLINKDQSVRKVYADIINKTFNSETYKNYNHYDYFLLRKLINTYFTNNKELKQHVYNRVGNNFEKHKSNFNKTDNKISIQKLKTRIAHNLIIPSYARNQDRFMEFGIRYLAEKEYFGEDAQFKMYKFYTSQEQSDLYDDLDDKALDKVKFKGGKEVAYSTYAESLKRYPEWDTPFVVENNAVFVKLPNVERPIAIQRNLLIYFLEDALFQANTKSRGSVILSNYVYDELNTAKKTALEILRETSSISTEQKKVFKKLLPRRLLNHYCAAQHNYNANNSQPATALRKILDKALTQEERYAKLLQQAKEERREDLFIDKNKGKNFKLTFIRKACNILYFRDVYEQKSARLGHHKSLHITRDEFNDFCRWMYAFDTMTDYKKRLENLFESKGFFENADFRNSFMQSKNLNDFYEKVKENYEAWLTENENKVKTGKHDLDSYDQLLHKGVLYINVKHFKDFLARKRYFQTDDKDKFKYSSLANTEYLLPCFYSETGVDKTFLFDLRKTKHEDCLLYEIALRYFKEERDLIEKTKAPVREILSRNIELKQHYEDNGQPKEYTVVIPLKNVDKWLEIQGFYEKAEKDDKEYISLLKRLPFYLMKNQDTKDLKQIAETFSRNAKIEFSDFSKVNNHIINHQAKFTNCMMALEEFYIRKNKLLVPPDKNRLDISDITGLNTDYPELKKMRDTALHFDLPMNETYHSFFTDNIEKQFAKEIDKTWTCDTLPNMHRNVLSVFLDKMRNDIFDKSKIYTEGKGKKVDVRKTEDEALKKYFKELSK